MLKVTLANGTVIEASTLEELEAVKSLFVSEKASKPQKATSKEDRWLKKQEEKKESREQFFATHDVVKTAEENRKAVYEAMGYVPGSGKYFDRELYKSTAKKMGVLGKSGRVVGTYKTK